MKKTAIICVIILVVNSAQAAITTSNLLTNPGAEEGDMTGWTTAGNVKAVRAIYETTGVVQELSGDYFFTMGLGRELGPSSMSQTIDLSAFTIGTLVSFKAGGYVQTEFWPPKGTAFDKGKLIIEPFDSSDNSLGQFTLDPVEHPVLGSYENGSDYDAFSLSDKIPAGTSYAVLTLEGYLVQGVLINVFYDDLFFAVNVEASVEMKVSVNGREPSDEVDAELGDYITVTLTVENSYDNEIKIEDVLPEELKYIPNTFEVDDNAVVPAIAGNTISTLVPNGVHVIAFDVQVVEVQAEQEGTLVTHNARLYDPTGDRIIDCTSVDIALHPYKGFSKGVEQCTIDPWNAVPLETDVHWLLLIEVWNVVGDGIATMKNIVVNDLDVDEASTQVLDPPPSSGTITSEKTAMTKNVRLTWDVGDLDEGDPPAQLWVEISTSLSPGKGQNNLDSRRECSSTVEYELSSNAVVSFIDSNTGFKLSAHTSPLVIKTVPQPEPEAIVKSIE